MAHMTAEASLRFAGLLRRSLYHDEAGDCSVMAASVAAGVSYEKAHDAMASAGRRHRGGVRYDELLIGLQVLGCQVYTLEMRALEGKTIRTIARELEPEERYILVTNNHVAAYAEGSVVDWSADRLLRVKAVLRITR